MDPGLTYEQNQLEMFSLRNDRFCSYSITIQYWHEGKQVLKSTGAKHQRFGKSKSQLSSPFEIEVPLSFLDNEKAETSELRVMYSMIFPVE